MWICLNNSFVSIVVDRQVPGNLLVRARRKDHLRKFVGAYKGAAITEDAKRDYRFRVSLPRQAVACMAFDRAMDVEYDNFKGSVGDKELHDMYTLWWGDHVKLQKK